MKEFIVGPWFEKVTNDLRVSFISNFCKIPQDNVTEINKRSTKPRKTNKINENVHKNIG